MPRQWLNDLDRDGIVTVPEVMSSAEVDALVAHLQPLVGEGAGDRGLHRDPVVQALATDGPLGSLAREVLGSARVARVLYFDKNPAANWKVPYHQDVTIAVADKVDVPGFSGWSSKEGITHVRAPAEILEKMVALRLHLDDCGPENGPLRAIPGSHKHGKLTRMEVERLIAEEREQIYTAPRGGVILMRPLTLHASSQAASPNHRRVLHIEYASTDLPSPLAWYLGS